MICMAARKSHMKGSIVGTHGCNCKHIKKHVHNTTRRAALLVCTAATPNTSRSVSISVEYLAYLLMGASSTEIHSVMHTQPATQRALTLLLQKHAELKDNGYLTASRHYLTSDCNVLGTAQCQSWTPQHRGPLTFMPYAIVCFLHCAIPSTNTRCLSKNYAKHGYS